MVKHLVIEQALIPALSLEDLHALPESELTERVLHAESSLVATYAARELLSRTGFGQVNARGSILLAEELTEAQRAVAETLARREGLDLFPFAVPSARITRARWLGLEPPSVLEKMVNVELEGKTVSLPLWAARRPLKLSWSAASLTRWLSRRELLEAYAEVLLHGGYDKPNVFDHQEVAAGIAEQAVDFVAVAEVILAEAKRLWNSTDPHAHAERGTWTSRRANSLLAFAMLYPLALAGRTLGPEEAVFVPFQLATVGDHDLGRTIMLALREDVREATLLEAYEHPPTLTAAKTALDVLRFLPLPALAQRVARDFHDPALKKGIPKIPFDRFLGQVAAFRADMPTLAAFFDKPKRAAKKPAAKK